MTELLFLMSMSASVLILLCFLLFRLGKFKYMGEYLRWFYRKNFRKYVNISPGIWDTSFS